jgi:hypothetical protein
MSYTEEIVAGAQAAIWGHNMEGAVGRKLGPRGLCKDSSSALSYLPLDFFFYMKEKWAFILFYFLVL